MKRRQAAADWLVGLIAIMLVDVTACSKPKPKPPVPVVASTSLQPCAGGETRDPPHREARSAIQALRSKDYTSAARLFAGLLAKYPESASLRVWQGDALLGQDSAESVALALVDYSEARALDSSGCKLRERERYFLAVGFADTELRQKHVEPALAELVEAAREWPDSAEVAYHRARAECLLDKLDDCFADLQEALTRAHSRQRVRFARSHHGYEELRERAMKQTEFESLRGQPRYQALLASAQPADGGTGDP